MVANEELLPFTKIDPSRLSNTAGSLLAMTLLWFETLYCGLCSAVYYEKILSRIRSLLFHLLPHTLLIINLILLDPILFPPCQPLNTRNTRTLVHAAVLAARPVLALTLRLRLLAVPLAIGE